MLNRLFLFAFLCVTTIIHAHQPETSTTLLVEKDNNTWILQISASLTAFQQEIKTNFPEYKSPEEFQNMVLEHIKNNVEITFNENQPITLNNGIVKLGHETKVVFEVTGVPSEIKSVYVVNSAFNDIYKSQSALVLLKNGFDKEHFMLNDANNHTIKLVTDKNQFVAVESNKASLFSVNLLFVFIGICALSLLVFKKNNMKRKLFS